MSAVKDETNIAGFACVLTAPKYTAMVYKVVSVAPIIIQAVLAAMESAGFFPSISSSTAKEPLPEIGRISISGVHSEGNPRKEVIGSSKCESPSAAPELLNIPIAVIISISVGQSSNAVIRFSLAPSAKTFGISTFLITAVINTRAIMIGISRFILYHSPPFAMNQNYCNTAYGSCAYRCQNSRQRTIPRI